jgi:hypothetical protein
MNPPKSRSDQARIHTQLRTWYGIYFLPVFGGQLASIYDISAAIIDAAIRVQRSSDGSALACCMADLILNLGSALQGGSAHGACNCEEMEMGLSECYE